MSEKGQNRQGEIEVFNTEVRSLPLFNRVLQGVGEALCKRYGDYLRKEELPFLDPQRIEFVPDEEFMAFGKEDKVGENLVTQALRLAGLGPEWFPGKEDFADAISYASPLRDPCKVYYRQSFFKDLLISQDWINQFKGAILLGRYLIADNICFLPKPKITEDPWLAKLPEERLLAFFQRLQLEKAKEVFSDILKGDTSKKTFLYGAQIILALEEKQGGLLKGQFSVGEEINQGVALFLAEQPGKSLIGKLAIEFSIPTALLNFRPDREREKAIQKAQDFLWKLGLRDYLSIFRAYKESRIPEIFFDRLKVKPGLEYPS